MYVEYPDDPEAAKQDQQWMLGPDVLVAPIVTEGATSRSVYFPEGCWESRESGLRVEGPRSQKVDAPLGVLPYFFRCGRTPFNDVSEGGASLPSSRRCSSRRAFRIRLGRGLSSARVFVNGKRVRTLRGKRLRSTVNLRGLPKGRFTVRIVGRTKAGKTVVRKRAYRTCVPRPRR